MEKVTHNIEHEMKLISMLGFDLIGPDNSNRWLILDEEGNQVGFIQYKKLNNANAKKGLVKTYGYQTEIENKDFSYKATRKITNENEKSGLVSRDDSRFSYEFDIKRENGTIDHVKIGAGDYPELSLWSQDYGNMNFTAGCKGLYLDFKSKTENFNIEEIVVYEISREQEEYAYQLRYSDKQQELNDVSAFGVTDLQITGISTIYQPLGEMELIERTWENGKLIPRSESIVEGTVKEMVVNHEMGIAAFNHFRYLINQILPFKQEVISTILENYFYKEKISLFVPEFGKENKETVRQKN